MKKIETLANQLLVAMPALADGRFSQSVIYLCEYNEKGAMGIVVNKPLDIGLGEILRHLDIPILDKQVDDYRILRGGPIAPEQGFLLQRHKSAAEDDVSISAAKQDLMQLAEGKNLPGTLVALGYTGWSAGQLEQELKENAWLLAPADNVILFETPFELRWRGAAALIGVDFDRLSGDVGHA